MTIKLASYAESKRKAAYWQATFLRTLREADLDLNAALAALSDAEKAHTSQFRADGAPAVRRSLIAAQRALTAAMEAVGQNVGEDVLR